MFFSQIKEGDTKLCAYCNMLLGAVTRHIARESISYKVQEGLGIALLGINYENNVSFGRIIHRFEQSLRK
jgi:hypothetical protein